MVNHQIMSAIIQKDEIKLSTYQSSISQKKLSYKIQNILDLLPHHALIIQKHHLYANQSLRDYLGLKHQIYTLKNIVDAFLFEDLNDPDFLWENNHTLKKQLKLRNNQTHQYEWFLLLSKKHKDHILMTLTNIEQPKQMTNAQIKILDDSIDFIYIVSADGYIHHVNKSSRKVINDYINMQNTALHNIQWLDLLVPDVRKKAQLAFDKALNGQITKFIGISYEQERPEYWEHILTPMREDNGKISSVLCVSRDITAQKNTANILKKVANEHDKLTGLLNREGLKKILNPMFKKAMMNQQKIGFILINLDHFKHINKALGHTAGDYVLKILAKQLENFAKNQNKIARLGGDEFAVVIPHLINPQQLLDISQQLVQLFEDPIQYKDHILNEKMSIGCAIFPDHGKNFSTLLQCAEIAITDIKAKGRGDIRLFNKDMLTLIQNKTKQLETAHFILRNHLIEPFYQPKIDLQNNNLVGMEALLRWQDQQGAIHTPNTVHEAFNDFELSSQISAEMQYKIFEDIKKWQADGKKIVPIAINVSPVEFLRNNYAEILLERIRIANIPPQYIEIEITEHLFSDQSVNYVIRALNKLRDNGIKISLDDFGTGYSSLSHLRDFPVDTIKIDYSFVNRMMKENSINAIVDGLIKLAPLLSMKIIAEGIENKEQFQTLKDMGCHEGQGYFFSKAVNHAKISTILNNL